MRLSIPLTRQEVRFGWSNSLDAEDADNADFNSFVLTSVTQMIHLRYPRLLRLKNPFFL